MTINFKVFISGLSKRLYLYYHHFIKIKVSNLITVFIFIFIYLPDLREILEALYLRQPSSDCSDLFSEMSRYCCPVETFYLDFNFLFKDMTET